MRTHGVDGKASVVQQVFVLYSFFNAFEFLKNLHAQLVAQVIPLFLQTFEFLHVTEVFGAIPLATFEKESKQVCTLLDQFGSFLVLFVDAKFSKLLNAYH